MDDAWRVASGDELGECRPAVLVDLDVGMVAAEHDDGKARLLAVGRV
jgi:hypothetical protein